MPWTEAERLQLRPEILLRYIVVEIGAQSGAVFRPREAAPLLLVARTDLWPATGNEAIERLWNYSQRKIVSGEPQRHRHFALFPLYERAAPQLCAILGLGALNERYAPSDDHRALFERLARDVVAPQPPDYSSYAATLVKPMADAKPAGGRNALVQAQRDQIEEALAACRGNVAATARRLGMPLRTLWGHITRHEIDTHAFRLRAT